MSLTPNASGNRVIEKSPFKKLMEDYRNKKNGKGEFSNLKKKSYNNSREENLQASENQELKDSSIDNKDSSETQKANLFKK